MAAPNLPHAVLKDDDGFTVDRFINAVPRLYPALKFTHRPVDSAWRGRLIDKRQTSDEETLTLRLSEVVAQRIVSWDAVDQKGKDLPITPEGVLALHPGILQRLFNIIVWSAEAGDPPPNASQNESHDDWSKPDAKLVEGAQGNS